MELARTPTSWPDLYYISWNGSNPSVPGLLHNTCRDVMNHGDGRSHIPAYRIRHDEYIPVRLATEFYLATEGWSATPSNGADMLGC